MGELRVVLGAIAEAGGLNVTFANLPATKVTLRMGQQVSKAEALDVLRGVAEVNGLKMTESPSLIRIEGTRPVTQQQQQDREADGQDRCADSQNIFSWAALSSASASCPRWPRDRPRRSGNCSLSH